MPKIAQANIYVANKRLTAARKTLLALNVPIIGTCESQKLGALRGYHRYGVPAGTVEDRRIRETAIYVRGNVQVDASGFHTVTKDVGRNAHPRTIVWVYVRLGGVQWCFIEVHSNPQRRGRARKENVALMDAARDVALRAEADGRRVVLMGDWNRKANERGLDTPYWLAKAIGGRLTLAKVDGFVTGEDVDLDWFRNHGTIPGGDHPLVVASVSTRPR